MLFRYRINDSYDLNFKTIECDSVDDVIKAYTRKIWVYDCDTCGTDEFYMVINSGDDINHFYRIVHDYGWNYGWREGDDDCNYVENDFEITKITPEEFPGVKVSRDWINLGSYIYRK